MSPLPPLLVLTDAALAASGRSPRTSAGISSPWQGRCWPRPAGVLVVASPPAEPHHVDAVLDDLPVAAVKTGMLATAEIVDAVAALAAAGRLPNLVVDPVMVSSTRPPPRPARRSGVPGTAPAPRPGGDRESAQVQVLLGRLLVTPDDVRRAAGELSATGCETVVITGGDPTADRAEEAADVWFDGELHDLVGRRVSTANNHGTGCSFASAVAARLADGDDVAAALAAAKEYVARALAGGRRWRPGAGHGPIDHFAWEDPR
ncbi:MAG: bifunctional hydroxymethylpyrimidine kinase/phosphomethylpyrimidine kinase [Acidimicrobiia bacterium]|nr:bifunctional hydroxymethylpyrimidine kinase/phosphomethylpyrimidine kinase [Acidimicrobiia bacterium]